MFKSIDKAPEAFMARYNKIMNGEENLDTIAKLKDFWLFAIEQGNPHREMREYIAQLVEIASGRADAIMVSRSVLGVGLAPSQITSAFDLWEAFKGMDQSPYPKKQTAEEYNDQWWRLLKDEIMLIEA